MPEQLTTPPIGALYSQKAANSQFAGDSMIPRGRGIRNDPDGLSGSGYTDYSGLSVRIDCTNEACCVGFNSKISDSLIRQDR